MVENGLHCSTTYLPTVYVGRYIHTDAPRYGSGRNEQSPGQSINQSINELVNQSGDKSIMQSIDYAM